MNHMHLMLQHSAEQLLFLQDARREFGPIMLQKMLERFQILQLFEKDVLYNIGDRDNKYYVLLKGKLEVFMELQSEIVSKVAELRPVSGFGEIALYSRFCRRNQKIVASSHVTLLYLERHHYKILLGKQRQPDNFETKIHRLSSYGCFESWTLGQYKKFSYYLRELRCELNEVIYKEGASAEFLYIIESGEFQLTKQIERTLKPKTLCILNQGQIFGEECFLPTLTARPQISFPKSVQPIPRYATVKCISLSGLLYRIRKQDIEERLWDQITCSQFESLLDGLKTFRMQRWEDLMNCHQNICEKQSFQQLKADSQKLVEIATFRNIKYYKAQLPVKQRLKIEVDALPAVAAQAQKQKSPADLRQHSHKSPDPSQIYQRLFRRMNSLRSEESESESKPKLKANSQFHKKLGQRYPSQRKTKKANLSLEELIDLDFSAEIFEHKQFLASAQIKHSKPRLPLQ